MIGIVSPFNIWHLLLASNEKASGTALRVYCSFVESSVICEHDFLKFDSPTCSSLFQELGFCLSAEAHCKEFGGTETNTRVVNSSDFRIWNSVVKNDPRQCERTLCIAV